MSAQIIPFPSKKCTQSMVVDIERTNRIKGSCQKDGFEISDDLAHRIAELFRVALLEATPIRL